MSTSILLVRSRQARQRGITGKSHAARTQNVASSAKENWRFSRDSDEERSNETRMRAINDPSRGSVASTAILENIRLREENDMAMPCHPLIWAVLCHWEVTVKDWSRK